MFVVMALVLTFITTPLAIAIYPPKHRTAAIPTSKTVKDEEKTEPERRAERGDDGFKSRFSVILNRIEHLPAIMTLTQLLQPSPSSHSLETSARSLDKPTSSRQSTDVPALSYNTAGNVVTLDALRLIELTERTSAVMQSSEAYDLLQRDALVSIFRTFGHLNAIPVSASLSVVSHESFSQSVESHVQEKGSDMVIIPWHIAGEETLQNAISYNPFEGVFGQAKAGSNEKASSVLYSQFVRRVFGTAPTDVALFIDRGMSLVGDSDQGASLTQHIVLPFMGGPDDRMALEFVIQLCANPHVTATVLRIKRIEDDTQTPIETETDLSKAHVPGNTVMSTSGFPDTIYAPPTTQTRMESENADNLIFSRYVPNTGDAAPALPTRVKDALKRITFDVVSTAAPLRETIEYANAAQPATGDKKRNLLVLVGRGRRMAAESHHAEIRLITQGHAAKGGMGIGGETLRALGDVATAMLLGTKASVLVMQASMSRIPE
jgi:hypothetical protein